MMYKKLFAVDKTFITKPQKNNFSKTQNQSLEMKLAPKA